MWLEINFHQDPPSRLGKKNFLSLKVSRIIAVEANPTRFWALHFSLEESALYYWHGPVLKLDLCRHYHKLHLEKI